MTNVIFSNYSISGSADGTPSESLSLNYESIVWDYKGAAGVGGADSTKNGTGSWDLSTNAKKASSGS
jgi:type VI protein secretion system component Hcp